MWTSNRDFNFAVPLLSGYPTLVLFPSGKKSSASAVPYSGAREADALMTFALGFAGDALRSTQLLNDKQVYHSHLLAHKLLEIRI